MNVDRLREIAQAIVSDINTTGITGSLETLTTSLQEQVNSPQHADPQRVVSSELRKLDETLSNAPSNQFSPTWQQAANELGADGLLGESLKERIETIFASNQITPSVALSELRQILNQVKSLHDSLARLIKSMQELGIGSQPLVGSECEIGVLVPRGFVDNKLDRLGAEFNELNKIFSVFSEIAIGQRPGFKVRAIASSDFNVYLEALPAVAACIAVAIERIIATYKNLLDIRKHHRDLESLGIPEANLEGIQDHANSLMATEIDALDKELLQEFLKQTDPARRNELEIELRLSLSKIANRIDRGFHVEIRIPLALSQSLETDSAASQVTKKHLDLIKESTKALEFIKVDGPPILRLPEKLPDPRPKAVEPRVARVSKRAIKEPKEESS